MNQKIKFKELSNFFEKQWQALQITKHFDYVLYGGTLGGGKSRFIRWVPVYWLLRWYNETGIKGIRTGVFCEDYPSLNDRHLTYVKEEFPIWLGRYNEQRHEFKLAPEYGGGVIAFRNLDDPEKYLSVEFALIAMDEINRNPKETFDKLRRRKRWPGIEKTKFIGACNPVGEPWVPELWIDKVFPKELLPLKDQFIFIESKPTDNPYLPQSYYDDLKTQDPTFVEAALGGDWHAYDSFMDKKGYMPIIRPDSITKSYVDEPIHSQLKVILIDPAAGGDDSAIILASETCREVLFSQPLEDTMSLVALAIKYFDQYDCIGGAIDGTGLGRPIYQRLKELGYDFISVDFAEKPDDEIKFSNKKAELFWKEKDWLYNGGKLVKHTRFAEWNVIKYKNNSDGIIQLESKERLRERGVRSPDVVDAEVLAQAINWRKHKKKIRENRLGKPEFRDNIRDSMWRK